MTGVVVQFRLDGIEQVKKELQAVSTGLKQTAQAANDSSIGGLTNFTRGLEETSLSLTRLGTNLVGIGTKWTLGISAPLVAAGAALFHFTADANEAEGRFNLLMGSMGDEARAFSVKLREELGLNEFQVREQISSFFQMSQTMGIAKDTGLDMAKGLTVLTADMVSLFNLEPDAAFDKLHQAMLGNSRGLKELNIIVDENTIKQTAMTHGLIRQGDEMTEQQKVLARYLTILDQTQKVQGDLARNLDSPTNQLRKMTNEVKQAAIELGQALMPQFQKLIADVLKPLAGLLVNLAEKFRGLSPEMQKLAIGIVAAVVAIGPLLVALGTLLKVSGLLLGASGLAGLIKLFSSGTTIAAIGALGLAFGTLAAAVLGVAAAFGVAFGVGRLLVHWADTDFGTALGMAEQDINDFAGIMVDKVTGMVDSVKKSVTGMFTTTDGKNPADQITKDTKAAAEEIQKMMDGTAKSAQDSFGSVVKDSEKATLEQLKHLEALRTARERAESAHRSAAESSAELFGAIATDQIRDIERLAEYDIDSQYRMLQAELTHYEAMGSEGAAAADLILAKMRELEVQMQDRTFGGGLRAAIGEMTMRLTDMGAVARDIVGVAFNGLTATISNFIQTGKLSFKDLIHSMKVYLADFLASQIVGKFLTFLAGLAGITVSGGASAGGGVNIGGGGGGGGGINIGTGGGGGGSIGDTVGNIPGLSSVGSFIQGGQDVLATSVGNLLLKAGVSPEFASGVVGNIANAGLANAGAGMAGSFAAGLLGADGLDANIGGAVGGIIGTAFGPIGTFVGSFLGSMIGDFIGDLISNPSYPYARANMWMDNKGKISVTGESSLDGGDEMLPNVRALGEAIFQSVAGTLADLGLPIMPMGFPVGYDDGRPGSKLGKGFWVGNPGTFEGGAMFSELSVEGAFASGVQYALGRNPAAVAALAAKGVEIPSYETGGDLIATRPTLFMAGERPERISVRHLGNGGGGGGAQIVIQGPNFLDRISARQLARRISDEINAQAMRGLA